MIGRLWRMLWHRDPRVDEEAAAHGRETDRVVSAAGALRDVLYVDVDHAERVANGWVGRNRRRRDVGHTPNRRGDE